MSSSTPPITSTNDVNSTSSNSPHTSTAASNDIVDDDAGVSSSLIFPSYDEFSKQLNSPSHQTIDEPTSSSNLDEMFAVFQNEINELTTNEPQAKKAKISDEASPSEFIDLPADQHCIRLTAQLFSNPFQVLNLTPDASEDDIKRYYRKISLAIHPDKCKHPQAREAFQILLRAYEQLQKPEMRKKYEKVIDEAKKRVMKLHSKENKLRLSRGEAPLQEEESEFNKQVMEMCNKILAEQEERRKYAEACLQANERYERERDNDIIKESIHKREEKKEWEETRDTRVNSWRNFKGLVEDKKVKFSAFGGVRHQKEQRTKANKLKVEPGVKKGVDKSYKVNWK